MAGSSCLNCVFSQWEGQHQNGCALRRLDKYENTAIVTDDYTGSYFVTVSNICPAKRTKSWLSEHPRNPVEQVRKELFPKLQLIVLIDEVNKAWIDFFANTDLSKYSAVDVLIFQPENTIIKSIGNFLTYGNIFIHACMPVEHSLCSIKEHHINNFVRKDCQFYLLVDDPNNSYVEEWPNKLDNYLNDKCKPLALAGDLTHTGDTLPYNNKIVYTPMHFMLGGYGSQSIDTKIGIHAVNHDQAHLLVYAHEVWSESDESTPSA